MLKKILIPILIVAAINSPLTMPILFLFMMYSLRKDPPRKKKKRYLYTKPYPTIPLGDKKWEKRADKEQKRNRIRLPDIG